MDNQIQKILDLNEIRNLRYQYAHHLDGNNIDEMDQVFSDDAVVEVTVGKMEGIEAIKKGLRDAYVLFDRDHKKHYPFMHVIANHVIDITGPETAEGKCYLIDFETAQKEEKNPLLLLGLYKDQYKKIDGVWKITHTVLDVTWDN